MNMAARNEKNLFLFLSANEMEHILRWSEPPLDPQLVWLIELVNGAANCSNN